MNAVALTAAIPLFFVAIALEVGTARRRRRDVYGLEDGLGSLYCGVTQQACAVLLAFAIVGVYAWLHANFALVAIDTNSITAWALLVVLVDLAYYAAHRISHRVNFSWAAHAVHHQSEEYNLTTALRQSALQDALNAWLYWPLAIVGFPPAMFVAVSTANTLYQFGLHTRLIDRLPRPIEWLFNTPSHHRVHHGIDPAYIDKNYGGMFIVWDRLLGTFEPERNEPHYGTVTPLRSWDPVEANAVEWRRLLGLALRTRSLRDALRVWFAPPEWRPSDLGGPVTIPAVGPDRVRYAHRSPMPVRRYVLAQFVPLALAVVALLVLDEGALTPQLGALAAWILLTTASCGALLEGAARTRFLEPVRLVSAPVLVLFLSGSWMAAGATAAIAGGSLLLWRRAMAHET